MTLNFNEVAKLKEKKINAGDRWAYVADFNTKHKGDELKSTERIDAEIPDILHIISQGGKVGVLAHKGRFKDGDAENLDFVVPYLTSKLGHRVVYFPENNTPAAVEFIKNIRPGMVAVMGNVRQHPGEEKNDPALAEQFAALAEDVAVGGFGKAHREEASNVGIQKFKRAYATDNQLKEMDKLALWAGKDKNTYSVAVLGGIKKEKITTGLAGFVETYDAVIPGGIVLNTIMRVMGYPVGASKLEDGGKTFERAVSAILSGPHSHKILMPEKVIMAKKIDDGQLIDQRYKPLKEGILEGYQSVDFVPSQAQLDSLETMVSRQGRLILAGTPGIYPQFPEATEAVLARMRKNKDRCVVLGGDTAAEVNYDGPSSTGGGSALHFVAYGTTPVFEALRKNFHTFAH
ncbi:MAG: phosphoglycerate kinase [archaeon]